MKLVILREPLQKRSLTDRFKKEWSSETADGSTDPVTYVSAVCDVEYANCRVPSLRARTWVRRRWSGCSAVWAFRIRLTAALRAAHPVLRFRRSNFCSRRHPRNTRAARPNGPRSSASFQCPGPQIYSGSSKRPRLKLHFTGFFSCKS